MKHLSKQTSQISRAQARARGLQFYFTGLPCKRGHLAQRRTGNGSCLECEGRPEDRARKVKNVTNWRHRLFYADPAAYREKRAEEARNEYAKNPAPRKAAAKRYAEKNREKIAKRMRRWRDRNVVHLMAYEANRPPRY